MLRAGRSEQTYLGRDRQQLVRLAESPEPSTGSVFAPVPRAQAVGLVDMVTLCIHGKAWAGHCLLLCAFWHRLTSQPPGPVVKLLWCVLGFHILEFGSKMFVRHIKPRRPWAFDSQKDGDGAHLKASFMPSYHTSFFLLNCWPKSVGLGQDSCLCAEEGSWVSVAGSLIPLPSSLPQRRMPLSHGLLRAQAMGQRGQVGPLTGESCLCAFSSLPALATCRDLLVLVSGSVYPQGGPWPPEHLG